MGQGGVSICRSVHTRRRNDGVGSASMCDSVIRDRVNRRSKSNMSGRRCLVGFAVQCDVVVVRHMYEMLSLLQFRLVFTDG